MKIYLDLKINELQQIKNLIDLFDGRKIIVSLIQNSRKLESILDVSDFIIYDNSDIMVKIISSEDAVIEVDENLDLIPSSYKKKTDKFDYNILSIDFIDDYDFAFILFDENIEYINKPKTIIVKEDASNISEKNQYILLKKEKINYEKYNIVGYLQTQHLQELKDNIQNNKKIEKVNKSFFEKIKGIFKNGKF